MKRLILATLLVSIPAHADIYLGAWSSHLSGGDYNETHNLIAYEHNQFIGGYFKNSYSHDTYFIGYKANVVDSEYVNAGIMFGGMHGYKDRLPNVKGWTGMFSMYISFGSYAVKPTLLNLGDAVAVTPRIDEVEVWNSLR